MLRITEVKLALEHGPEALAAAVAAMLGLEPSALGALRVHRRGYDARGVEVRFVYSVDVEVPDEAAVLARADRRVRRKPDECHRFPVIAKQPHAERPVIIGTGPCGLFAGLALARMGLRPLLLERGQPVKQRTKDVLGFWRGRVFKPGSNVQFGEGGAGTFSDGKLYSGVKDRGHHGRRVKEELVAAGAPKEITFISKPHIGTLRLVKVIENLRGTIEALGGSYRFDSQVVDFEIEDGQLLGLRLASGQRIAARQVVLAIGHSARDTFEVLRDRGVPMERKPFSVGLRIEHPQSVIDRARFGRFAGHPLLGAADYKLVHHASNGRSVYSFCMCPGGEVVAATSEAGRVVTNGMSHYGRTERNANAGLVVGIEPGDFGGDDPLAGVSLQRDLEARAYVLGGSSYDAPVQTVGDFLAGRSSGRLGDVLPSYRPGICPADLGGALPGYAIEALREAIPAMDRKLRGFAREDAVLTGVETRTSSPIRMPRDEARQSAGVRGLYPAGEGAGFAGGILSSAIDGMKSAEALAVELLGKG